MMNRNFAVLLLAMALTLLAGCGGGSASNVSAPLSADNLNLIFVLSPDLDYQAPGDVDPATANLTSQGLQRSLLMATFLQQHVLGMNNVAGIYALEPMTHLQTAGHYPDMAALENIQQFAMLNQVTMSWTGQGSSTANSYPVNASYGPDSLPGGVIAPSTTLPCPNCQGLVFNDTNLSNLALVDRIVKANIPGFHVFSAPWETISTLLENINKHEGYGLTTSVSYNGPNLVYAISIKRSGSASLVIYDSKLNPPTSYPVLSPPRLASCAATPFSITATGAPAGTNTNQTLYIVRHADAHPTAIFADGNYVASGQWRSLALPNALRGKISPTQVYSIDPSQVTPGTLGPSGYSNWSNPAPALTVQPYAIANGLPYNLVTSFLIYNTDTNQLASTSSSFFFSNATFSSQATLLGWQYAQIQPMINALITRYQQSTGLAPPWSATDYDSVWTVRLDGDGNLTVSNATCEGIDSAALPVTAPQF
jgi:hypothetical protein